MAAAVIIKNDTGTIFETTVSEESGAPLDLSGATLIELKLRPPVGADKLRMGMFFTDGTDGKVRYFSVFEDLDIAGEWQLQWYFEVGSSVKFHTTIINFVVLPPLG